MHVGSKGRPSGQGDLIQSKNGPGVLLGAQVWNVDIKFPRYQSNIRGGYIILCWQDLLLIPARSLWDDRFRGEAESKPQCFSSAKRGQMRESQFHKLSFFMSFQSCAASETRAGFSNPHSHGHKPSNHIFLAQRSIFLRYSKKLIIELN